MLRRFELISEVLDTSTKFLTFLESLEYLGTFERTFKNYSLPP